MGHSKCEYHDEGVCHARRMSQPEEIETMRLFIAEALMMLSSVQSRSNPAMLDEMETKANCFMSSREAAEIILRHDWKERED